MHIIHLRLPGVAKYGFPFQRFVYLSLFVSGYYNFVNFVIDQFIMIRTYSLAYNHERFTVMTIRQSYTSTASASSISNRICVGLFDVSHYLRKCAGKNDGGFYNSVEIGNQDRNKKANWFYSKYFYIKGTSYSPTPFSDINLYIITKLTWPNFIWANPPLI